MAQYEVTFIVDPVLSGDESKATAKTYQDMLAEKGGTIVNVDNVGLRSLAYPINKRTTGVYYCVEFQVAGAVVDELELAMRRDERIMRFLTVKLDKYGIKYNDDKRNGRLTRREAKVVEEIQEELANEDTLAATNPVPAKAPAAPPEPVREQPEVVPTAETIPADKPVEAVEINTGTGDDVINPKGNPVVIAEPAILDDAVKHDLTRIEGIGPKVNELLQNAGINTFDQLAKVEPAKVKEVLELAGGVYKSMDPSTWGQQAQLVVDGKDDELKALQDSLDGGKVVA